MARFSGQFSFVQVMTVRNVHTDISLQRELCVSADSVSDARELFAQYQDQFVHGASDHFEIVAKGEVMNTFESGVHFGKFVTMRGVQS